ncbi:rhomboid-domain-containing protein [Poronia punctata]|nr:rhomboid-domain-containing protein [Poronia punctata]
MFRAQKFATSFFSFKSKSKSQSSSLFRRSFSSDGHQYHPLPRVRLLAPTLWSVAACSTIYIGFAAFEVYRDARRVVEGFSSSSTTTASLTFEKLERLGDRDGGGGGGRGGSGIWRRLPTPTETETERSEFSEPQKLSAGIIALTTGIHLASAAAPAVAMNFVHLPVSGRNITLLTSVFGHAGLVHLGVNMYAMWWLMPTAAHSRTFRESTPHLAAFYLSAGILSSLAQHATAVWPRPNFMAALGASGALFALFGVVGVSYPNTNVGILFLPGSVPIGQMMAYVALFDAVGIFVRYPFLRLGHAAHLGGLAVGYAYAKYAGDERIWRPARKVTFKTMQTLRIL